MCFDAARVEGSTRAVQRGLLCDGLGVYHLLFCRVAAGASGNGAHVTPALNVEPVAQRGTVRPEVRPDRTGTECGMRPTKDAAAEREAELVRMANHAVHLHALMILFLPLSLVAATWMVSRGHRSDERWSVIAETADHGVAEHRRGCGRDGDVYCTHDGVWFRRGNPVLPNYVLLFWKAMALRQRGMHDGESVRGVPKKISRGHSATLRRRMPATMRSPTAIRLPSPDRVREAVLRELRTTDWNRVANHRVAHGVAMR